MPHFNLFVIGGDAAGMGAASQARRIDKSISIGVIEKGEFISYAACGMPYYVSGEIEDYTSLLVADKDEFIIKRNIQVFTGTEAISADLKLKKIIARSPGREETFTYDKLVIATGAASALPPLKGTELPDVMILKSLADGIRIRKHIDSVKPAAAVIIGAGFIGLELAEAFVKKGIIVTLIEKADGVAPAFTEEFRKIISATLSKWNVNAVTGTGVSAIKGSAGNFTIETDKGMFDAGMVIVSAGVKPNTGFLQGSGIQMLPNGAIIVDDKCGTSVPDVWAAGDCATVRNIITNKTDYIPIATNANKQGRVAGLQAAGVKTEIFNGAAGTQMVKIFELEAAKTGFNKLDAAKNGIDVIEEYIEWKSRAGYYPGTRPISIKLTVRADNRKVIGAEIAGTDGAALRINPVAVAITAGMTVEELAYADFGYSPPFAPVWDPVIAVAQNFIKRIKSTDSP